MRTFDLVTGAVTPSRDTGCRLTIATRARSAGHVTVPVTQSLGARHAATGCRRVPVRGPCDRSAALATVKQEVRMRSRARSLVSWVGVSLVAMIVVTYATRSNETSWTLEHSLVAEAIESESPTVTHDAADAACGRCGDNFCNPRCGETPTSCPRDCAGVPMGAQPTVEPIELLCGKCGDNFCNPRCGETPTSCPRDCGGQTSRMDDASTSGNLMCGEDPRVAASAA